MNHSLSKKTAKSASISILLFCIFISLANGTAMAGSYSGPGAPTPTPTSERIPFEPTELPNVISDSISSATAEQLATAMDVPNSDLITTDLMGSDSGGVGVSDASLGEWFPTKGTSFALLSTGAASSAALPNSGGNLSTTLGGINNQQGNDLVRLHMQLKVPNDINCMNIDFAFYSEEFPEWVNSIYNDRFTAQLNDSSLSIVGNEVVAPGNFAFDTNNNVISVNTVFGVHSPTGTTYDGVTPRLRARTAVTPSSTIDVYLSIQDLGDSVYDSTVFLDNFFWSKDPGCEGGSQADSDGDGLMDEWETSGLTVNTGGTSEFVDLPAMGADPQHKDIFVEIDYMGPETTGGHTHKPSPAAIQKIVTAFDNAPVSNPDGTSGIHLHVDYGSDAPLTWGSSSTWGTLSHAEELTHVTNLGTANGVNYNWDAFDTLKQGHLTPGRAAVFHYNIWAHNLAPSFNGTSGISRNSILDSEFGSGSSDFIVSLGSWTNGKGTDNEQAGTFMHELGHNLGLRHGGEDHTQWKPNYLSVMNYSMQTRGLIINSAVGNFDYSRYDLNNLDENSLNETNGINIPSSVTLTLGTYHFCGMDNLQQTTNASTVDWNCDGDNQDTNVSYNTNEGMNWNHNTTLDLMTSQNDWDKLVYSGGAISQPGAIVILPQESEVIDVDNNEDANIPNSLPFVIFSDIPSSYWAWRFIESLYTAGVTGGCSASLMMYCPDMYVTRAQMAVFLLRSKYGNTYIAPAASGTIFVDVPSSYWAASWIEQLAKEGITGGCGNGKYCPDTIVTRDQMAVFLLRSKYGNTYAPPPATGTIFNDIPSGHWAGAWIEQLSSEGITGGCGNGNYCPTVPVSRAQMAVFLVATFNLP